MKSSNKSSIITGAILLGISALLTISLFLQLLDFGVGGPGRNNIIYTVGHVLYAVYGFCSCLIPLFLIEDLEQYFDCYSEYLELIFQFQLFQKGLQSVQNLLFLQFP